MIQEYSADFVLYCHFLYVLGVLVPIPLILIGGWLDWRWVRNLWLRRLHLAMIGIVVIESVFGIACPLTVWEEHLRQGTGAEVSYPSGFIAEWISKILFQDFEPWVFIVMYLVGAAVIAGLYLKVPPQKPQY
ncbi:hypothetical protein AZI85_02280 [Bdellovibrio bacteriovorus]|uniref:DUF2784 domain-containing protein n=1 Tax=Bdellovibrio bacteriovorus TaxID=959 RepID=A0A150WW99_BDEBC|nr:DUF2784 domain-containing protein [Bdellovibrio bacteriovorus]KYG70778.1 hypothetical protein AZI85_02280 [Bdellovibrio bacteriovorus]